jgi:hypothetical protein
MFDPLPRTKDFLQPFLPNSAFSKPLVLIDVVHFAFQPDSTRLQVTCLANNARFTIGSASKLEIILRGNEPSSWT